MEQSKEINAINNESWLDKLKSMNLQLLVMTGAILFIMLFFSIMTDWSYLTPRNIEVVPDF
ncbi:sugar ABC transporter permease, partial [Vibrio breoganii]